MSVDIRREREVIDLLSWDELEVVGLDFCGLCKHYEEGLCWVLNEKVDKEELGEECNFFEYGFKG